ncbi:MAG: TrbI/VirB10 family protein [Candidatus Omnitrophica bacterium]|nr:TrbI/VirB10 family protein [Candidatus Omnitrophota bacterium]MDE2009881.1 TrbI/VirB10 family protein [Candidatus Omnitrophota bacterium]MDE2214337.1 TrbI/VirB10 family protein [Candidatus Omnitrophota bacterium]MDE2231086.1 TrbI/VirB10 family protein [Candidatus Omnitrophota bacterium]
MSVNNLFLRTDNAGRRRPTVLTFCLIVALVFFSFFISKNKKPVGKTKTNQAIIKARNLTAAAPTNTVHLPANPLSREGKAFKLDYKQVLQAPSPTPRPTFFQGGFPGPTPQRSVPLNTKMIVFDNTSNYQSNWVVPLGSMVKCILIHNIVTNNFQAPVIAQVWQDFYFDGKLLLPFGTRIYGTASAGRERDRVTVSFHDIVFQDGKDIKMNAIGLSQDGSGGLTGTVINDATRKTIWAMAMNLLSGMALGFQQTQTNLVTGVDQVESNARNALLNGVANTFQKQAQTTQQDIENSKGYAIVLAGSELIVYFNQKADVQGG